MFLLIDYLLFWFRNQLPYVDTLKSLEILQLQYRFDAFTYMYIHLHSYKFIKFQMNLFIYLNKKSWIFLTFAVFINDWNIQIEKKNPEYYKYKEFFFKNINLISITKIWPKLSMAIFIFHIIMLIFYMKILFIRRLGSGKKKNLLLYSNK